MNTQAVAAIRQTIEAEKRGVIISVRFRSNDAEILREVATQAGVRPAECARLLVCRGLTAIAGQSGRPGLWCVDAAPCNEPPTLERTPGAIEEKNHPAPFAEVGRNDTREVS